MSIYYKNIYSICVVFITTSLPFILLSQVGSPTIINHHKDDYKGGISNWDITCDDEKVYVANNAGLLIYNGYEWSGIQLPNKSIVRSVYTEQNKIYVGGQDEVGYIKKDNDSLQFISIRDKIPEINLPLEDIWNITVEGDFIYFISVDRVYIIGKDQTKIIHSGNPIYSLTKNNNGIFYIDHVEGVIQLKGFEKSIYFSSSEMSEAQPTVIQGIENQLYGIDTKNKLFSIDETDSLIPFNSEVSEYISKNYPISIFEKDGKIAVGTRYGGIVIHKKNGALISILRKKDGIQNNTTNKLVIDNNGNLWSATANGVDQIIIHDRKLIVYPDGDLQGSVFDVAEIGDYIYFGTNNGLYYQNKRDYNIDYPFQLIDGTQGQVWGLDVLDETLFVGHNNGAFTVNGTTLKKISPGIGAWKFVLAPDKKHMYVGTYFGVELYKKENDSWTFLKKYKYPEESSRIMVSGSGNNLWV